MGYRLSIDAISCDYYENEDDSRLRYHTKQLYYGTKLYGYGLDLEESLSYNFLLALGKFEDYDTYFGDDMKLSEKAGVSSPYCDYTYHLIKALEQKNDGIFEY